LETKWRQGAEVQFQGFHSLFNSLPPDLSNNLAKHGTAIYTRLGLNMMDE
jgi:hypothetical protein